MERKINPLPLTFASLPLIVALVLSTGCEAGGVQQPPVSTTTTSSGDSGSDGTGASAGSGGADNTQGGTGGASVEVCPHPHCPERLYGKRYLYRGGMAVDETHLFWCEGNDKLINTALKDGSGTITTLGNWHDFSPFTLVVDDEHLYWLRPEETGALLRVDKKDGSNPLSTPLPLDALGRRLDLGPIHDGGDSVFIGTHDCRQIVRVPKKPGTVQLWELHDQAPFGGVTAIGTLGQHVYCSNGNYIHRLDTATGEVTVIVEDQKAGGPFVFVDQYLYIHANQPTPSTPPYIGRIDLQAAKPATVDLGPSFGSSTGLFYDQARRRLYWTTGLTPTDAEIGSYHLDGAGPPELLFDKQDVYGGATMDEDYLYWMGGTGLHRLKKW